MLFVDSCDPLAIQEIMSMGIARGVTTNPLILAKRTLELGPASKFDVLQSILNASAIYPACHVFVQLSGLHHEQDLSLAEGYHRELGPRIAFKIPFSEVGLRIAVRLLDKGLTVNLTSLMTVPQVYLAALTGAQYVSLFMGRINDMNVEPTEVIRDARQLLTNEPELGAKIIVGSIRTSRDVMSALHAGAHIVTASPEILKKLLPNPGTTAVNAEFQAAEDSL